METTNFVQLAFAFAVGAFITYLYMRKYATRSEIITIPPTMNQNMVKEMVDNYRNNQLVAINEKLEMDDSYSVSFNLAAINNFANSILIESTKVKPELTENDLGIRIYYAAYPQSEGMERFAREGVALNYNMKHTVVMIPTIKRRDENGETMDYDFNPLDKETYNRTTSYRTGELKMMSYGTSSESDVMALNHGQLIPPKMPSSLTY